MKKILALVLSFMVVTAQATAVTGSNQSLKEAFDDLNFSLSVEWDQKDKAFYETQMSKFKTTITELRASGMTNEELLDFTMNNIKDEGLKNDLKQVHAIAMSEKLSDSEIQEMTQEILKRNYSKGASWIGAVLIAGAALIVIIAIVTSAIIYDASNPPEGKNCSYDYVCDSNGMNCSYTNYHCI